MLCPLFKQTLHLPLHPHQGPCSMPSTSGQQPPPAAPLSARGAPLIVTLPPTTLRPPEVVQIVPPPPLSVPVGLNPTIGQPIASAAGGAPLVEDKAAKAGARALNKMVSQHAQVPASWVSQSMGVTSLLGLMISPVSHLPSFSALRFPSCIFLPILLGSDPCYTCPHDLPRWRS